jgi:acyl-CoA synthetase (NDP forming)
MDFPKVLSYVAEDPRVDVVVTLTHFDWFPTSGMHNSAFGVNAVRGYSATTPTLLALLDPVDGAPPSQIVEAALAEDVLVLSGLDSGLRALENLVGWCQPTPALRTETASFPQPEILRLLDEMDGRPTSGMDGLRFLRAAGFNVAESRIAHDTEEAVALGLELGFPLVLKLGDATLLHKTEAGGVRVGIRDVAAIRRIAGELFALGTASVLVQRQIPDGAEVILGTQHNSELGGFVMVGLGGIWTEIADDVIFRPVGLRSGEAGQMLSQLRGYRSLQGARGAPVIDDAAVQEAIYRIDSLAALLGPRVAAIDINPLIVGPEGPVAVDVVVVPGGGT